MRRRDIFDFTAGCRERLMSARDLHLLSHFAWKFCSKRCRSCSLARAQTHKRTWNTYPFAEELLHLRTHSRTHTASPSHPHPLTSQRHKDIFIFHKAQTLMKHQRRKYISMIFQMWFQPPLLLHTAVSLSAHESQDDGSHV